MTKRKEFSYNGWASYETWLVSVWEFVDYFYDSAQDQGMTQVSKDWCKDMFMDMVSNDIPRDGIISDLVNGAIDRIDWYDISDSVNDSLGRGFN